MKSVSELLDRLKFSLRIIFILSLLLFILEGSGIAQNFIIEKITTRDGLSQNDINAIFQEHDGFLWIGTNDGLTRYDGYSFKTFRLDPITHRGIGSNIISCIIEDDNHNLWLGTADNGICRFNVITEKFDIFRNTNDVPNLLTSNQIVSLLVSKSGQVWIGTSDGLDLLQFENGKVVVTKNVIQEFAPNTNNVISEIREDVYGRIWVGTKHGLYVLSGKRGKIICSIIRKSTVKDIFIRDGEAYVAYSSEIVNYHLNEDSIFNGETEIVSGYGINGILINKVGDLYIGSNEGLFVFEKSRSEGRLFNSPIHYVEGLDQNNLNSNTISCIYEDNSGVIWIGTLGGGVNKYNPKQKRFRHYNKTRVDGSLSANKVRSIYQDRERNVWIGTEGGGVNFLPYSANLNFASGFKSFNVNESGNQNRVYSFVDMNKSGVIQLVAGCGYPHVFSAYEVKDHQARPIDSSIFNQIHGSPFTMINDHNGNLWIGTYSSFGLYLLKKDGNRQRLINYKSGSGKGSISSNHIRSLMEDNCGNIWIGTDNGLNLLTAKEQNNEHPKFVVFTNKADNSGSISHNYILPVFQSKSGTIWVGTMGGGLNKVIYRNNPDSISFESITTQQGLPSNVIKGILEDDYGFLWVSSNKGLSRFDVKDHHILNFDINDGLQDYEFGELACCKLQSGEMLFGGVNGINAFFPRDIISDMSVPNIALTDLQILNQSVKVGEKLNGRIVLNENINHTTKIRLKSSENSFSVYFASLHFSAPGKNQYQYMLEGFDNDWIRTSSEERFAKYTNLNSGRYIFKVTGSNSDGIWPNTPKMLEIEIVPPWWSSNLALIFYFFLFVGFVWLSQRYSLIKIQQRNALYLEHIEKEKVLELSQMKLRFFTNISHEFRTPLTLIIGPLETLIRQGKLPEDKVLENYSIMKRNASVLLRLINQLIDFRKMEQGKMELNTIQDNLIPFLRGMYLSFSWLAESKSIDYQYVHRSENINLWFDPNILERVVYNLLSNAFKFTPENGKIELMVEEDSLHVIIRICDSGIGIPKELQQHIFERFYQVKNGQSKKYGGTGIGLSFIRGLIELHKGEITFKSEENKGTTFTVKLLKGNAHLLEKEMFSGNPSNGFELPLEATDSKERENDCVELEDHAKNGPKLLIVEDNIELRNFIRDHLSNDYSVYTANNGEHALELIYKINPEVVVSDIMMPVKSGFELCETIKNDENISHTIVILLTAKTAEEDKIKGYSIGADGYISKPFSMEILKARIVNLINSRSKLKERFSASISVEPSDVTTTSMDEKFMRRILKIVEDNISNSEFTVEQLANSYGMSLVVLNRKLKGITGHTANSFIRTIRMKRAAQLFITGKYSIAEVTYEVGYADLKYFRNSFKREFNCSPSEYIKEHKV